MERRPCVKETETGVMWPQTKETGSSGSWERQDGGPTPQGALRGYSSVNLDFSFLVCREAPRFSVIGYRYLRKLSEGLSLEGLVHDSKPVCLTSISVSVANAVPSLCSTQSNFCPRGAESLLCRL